MEGFMEQLTINDWFYGRIIG